MAGVSAWQGVLIGRHFNATGEGTGQREMPTAMCDSCAAGAELSCHEARRSRRTRANGGATEGPLSQLSESLAL